MKIAGSPLAALKAQATHEVNERYNTIAAQNVHRDAAHAAKRAEAAAILAGATPSPEFSAEATLRGVSVETLAKDIAGRPNEAAQRELARQTELLAIASGLLR